MEMRCDGVWFVATDIRMDCFGLSSTHTFEAKHTNLMPCWIWNVNNTANEFQPCLTMDHISFTCCIYSAIRRPYERFYWLLVTWIFFLTWSADKILETCKTLVAIMLEKKMDINGEQITDQKQTCSLCYSEKYGLFLDGCAYRYFPVISTLWSCFLTQKLVPIIGSTCQTSWRILKKN